VESYLSGEKSFVKHHSPVQVQLPLPSTICCHFRHNIRKNTLQDIHFSIII
jgi:hypothetical protein